MTVLQAGCGRRGEAADYTLVAPAGDSVPAPGGAVAAVTLGVVVAPGTSRERLAAIRDELRERYRAVRLLRIGFYDDAAAASRVQGPDAPAPDSAWWGHYLAQYNLNHNTGYEWFGRLHPNRAERWE